MPTASAVAEHYTHGNLHDAIRAGVERLGKSPDTVTVEDLGPVDEFHIGGRLATEAFLEQLDLSPDHHVLDVGCGLGGATRFVAQRYGSRVTGIDLTPEYLETGRLLNSWVGLDQQIELHLGDATALSHPDGTFDHVYMMHVGMNVRDKHALFSELHRVLRPGGRLGIYDVMRIGDGDLTLPVPWASHEEANAVEAPEHYKDALEAAGFSLAVERNRREFALDFFANVRAAVAAAGGPPPLGIHVIMGESAPLKVNNMIENITVGRIAPVELIAQKPA